jgi:hypothetical protein
MNFPVWWATQTDHIEKQSRNTIDDSTLFYPIAKMTWEACEKTMVEQLSPIIANLQKISDEHSGGERRSA